LKIPSSFFCWPPHLLLAEVPELAAVSEELQLSGGEVSSGYTPLFLPAAQDDSAVYSQTVSVVTEAECVRNEA
jgi:hypothetical protein